MVNHVHLIGRLGKDPQLRHFSADNVIAEFSLATNETYKDKDGNFVELTEWHNIKLPFKWMAERAERTLKKGSLAFIEGKIKTRSYDDKDGNKRYITEIVAENFRALERRENNADGNESNTSENYSPSQNEGKDSDTNDDLPF